MLPGTHCFPGASAHFQALGAQPPVPSDLHTVPALLCGSKSRTAANSRFTCGVGRRGSEGRVQGKRGQVRGEGVRSKDTSARGTDMWLGQVARNLQEAKQGRKRVQRGQRIVRLGCWGRKVEGNVQVIGGRGGKCLLAQQLEAPGRHGGGAARGLTELERWARALMCSSSSKMRSSSSSVRCPGLRAQEGREANKELWDQGRAGATSPPEPQPPQWLQSMMGQPL